MGALLLAGRFVLNRPWILLIAALGALLFVQKFRIDALENVNEANKRLEAQIAEQDAAYEASLASYEAAAAAVERAGQALVVAQRNAHAQAVTLSEALTAAEIDDEALALCLSRPLPDRVLRSLP
jgi:hypothetical protein